MKIIIVGCGRLGAELAQRLCSMKNDVIIIDQVAAAFRNLPADFKGRTIEGDVLAQDVLYRAGIKQIDAIAAVTNSDVLNAVIARIAKEVYGIKKVVVRNYDPANRMVFDVLDAQVVSSTSWGAQRLEEIICQPETKALFSVGNGEVEVYELSITNAWDGHKLEDLIKSSACRVISLTHAGRAFLPDKDQYLSEGDMLYISAMWDGIQEIRERLGIR